MAGMSEKLNDMDLDGINQLSILKAKYARRQPRKQMIYGMIGRVYYILYIFSEITYHKDLAKQGDLRKCSLLVTVTLL